MRASCETEWLNEGHPAHVVAAWIGHSLKVQRDSYAQITDGHYDSFNNHPGLIQKSGHPSGTVETRNAENSSKLNGRPECATSRKTQKNPENSRFYGVPISGGGIRYTPQNTGETASPCESGAISGAVDFQNGASWEAIRALIVACEDLPKDVQRRLVALGDE